MLLSAIGYSLPMAVGIAISPIPIAAALIILSARPADARRFLLGWMAGLLVVGAVVLLLPGLDTVRGEPTPLSGWIRLLLGGALLAFAVWKWRKRPAAEDQVEAPRALSKLETASPGAVLSMAVMLSALNPKNLVLTFAGAANIGASMATPLQQAIALIVFALIASMSVGIPIIGYRLLGAQAETALAGWKDALVRNNAVVSTVLLLVFGALIIGNGMQILAT